MGGSMTFKTALNERLSIIRCSREQVNKLITDHPPQLTPGIRWGCEVWPLKPSTALSHGSSTKTIFSFSRELVDSLHQRNVKVFLISGGFRCIVEHVAAQLNIPQHHVYANRLKFYFNGESLAPSELLRNLDDLALQLLPYLAGEYAGFDESQPTAESGGKGKVISILKEQHGFKTVVMVGDGATDLEACPPAVSTRTRTRVCSVPGALQPHSRLLLVDRAPSSASGGTWCGSRWRSGARGTWRASASWWKSWRRFKDAVIGLLLTFLYSRPRCACFYPRSGYLWKDFYNEDVDITQPNFSFTGMLLCWILY